MNQLLNQGQHFAQRAAQPRGFGDNHGAGAVSETAADRRYPLTFVKRIRQGRRAGEDKAW